MLGKIERDVKRFRQIVRGMVKKDFRQQRRSQYAGAVP